MRQKTHLQYSTHFKLFGIALIETIWAIEANIVAGALPA
jgi:hypothetical protein